MELVVKYGMSRADEAEAGLPSNGCVNTILQRGDIEADSRTLSSQQSAAVQKCPGKQ
jgi:hypothetical protein